MEVEEGSCCKDFAFKVLEDFDHDVERVLCLFCRYDFCLVLLACFEFYLINNYRSMIIDLLFDLSSYCIFISLVNL